MDVAMLERLIAGALARMVRAQQQAAPVMDLCRPMMVSAEDRKRLQDARHELSFAYMNAQSAAQELAEAAGMLTEFLRPRDRAYPDVLHAPKGE